ncbi:2-dehydropantoate 2-reductase [Texcoconibacillus texcoconensis]|uniref:2-dehydropantoate 2-reductase n=1 Tax=Texcoconibacillus texcoconensis TaxID=1095777 RepID=A0A840QLF6_9BACI|nr:2-dehydropantoate 2-reductase [Texcoconibacillus texcoconensis]MBB5172186.1 2-dehydropantoate 2-reductase [Texcoconibacillus texcoconensis]
MKVAVIGSGAIGMLVAASLRSHDVTIYVRRKEQMMSIRERGIEVRRERSKEYTYPDCQRFTYDGTWRKADLIIFAMKQYDIQPLLEKLQIDDRQLPACVFLQNGMAHIPLLKGWRSPVVIGVVTHGAMKSNDRVAVHTGEGNLFLGELNKSGEPTAHLLASEMIQGGLKASYEHKIEQSLQQKLVINACINPLTALYDIYNGELLECEEYYSNLQALFYEVIQVIQIESVEEHWETVRRVIQQTANNRSSMSVDLRSNHKTEVDAILGYILEEGRSMSVSLPLVTFLYHSITGMERRQSS